MIETGAALGGEMSGHTFFKERWYGFDDAMYCGARLLEVVSRSANPSAVLDALPDSVTTPELKLELGEGEHFALIKTLQRDARFPDAVQMIDIDGLRIEYKDGFGLARASNTTPVVVLRFEGDTEDALKRIQEDFRKTLQPLRPEKPLPF